MARKTNLLTKKNAKGAVGCLVFIGGSIFLLFKLFFYYPLYFLWKGIVWLFKTILALTSKEKS